MNLRPVFYLLLPMLLCGFSGFSQSTYTFNTQLEFEYRSSPGSPSSREFFLTDSTKRGYKMQVFEMRDKGEWQLYFKDYKGSTFRADVTLDAFKNASRITADCGGVKKTVKSSKITDARKIKDSLIDGVLCEQYDYSVKTTRYGKSEKAYMSVWIEPTVAEVENRSFTSGGQTRDDDLPNGLVRYSYARFKGDNHKYRMARYKSKTTVKKEIVIPEACDYSEKLTKVTLE